MASLGDHPLQRLSSGYDELDRVLGGGLVPGSLVLVGEHLLSGTHKPTQWRTLRIS